MKMKQTNYRNLAFIILILSCLSTLPCFAENAPKAKGKKNTAINFEDELVEGEVQKPELLYLLEKKQFNFKRLIKLRKNFLPEMRRTAEEIQPVGSRH